MAQALGVEPLPDKRISKSSLVIRGRTFKTQKEMLETFGVPYNTFRARRRRGLSIEQSLGLKASPSSKRKSNKGGSLPKDAGKRQPIPVAVAGKTFRSISSCAKHYNIKSSILHKRLKLGWTPEQAVGIDPREKRLIGQSSAIQIRVAGEPFESLAKCATRFGISRATLSERLRKGWTPEQAVGLEDRKEVGGNRKKIECAGVVYASYAALARAYGVPYWNVRDRISLYGYTPEQAVGLDKSREFLREFEVAGQVYRSFSDACFAYDVDPAVAKKRLESGWSIAEALGLEDGPASNFIEFQGRKFNSMSELARTYGIPGEKVINRRSLGWTLEEALGIVERVSPMFGRYNEVYFEKYPKHKQNPSSLYFMRIADDQNGQTFYKIGITSASIEQRIASLKKNRLGVEVICSISLPLYQAWLLEQLLFDEYSGQRFTSEGVVFAGRTECFRFSDYQAEEVQRMILGFSEN